MMNPFTCRSTAPGTRKIPDPMTEPMVNKIRSRNPNVRGRFIDTWGSTFRSILLVFQPGFCKQLLTETRPWYQP